MRLERLATRLVTDRLLLRCYEPSDADALYTAIEESRAHLERWLLWPTRLSSIDDVAAWVSTVVAERYDATQSFGMGVFDKRDGRLLGGAGLKIRSFDAGEDAWRWVDIGYWLHQAATGRGYAREAVCALARHAFDDVDAERVEIRIECDNLESIAVAEGAGFRRDGVLRRTMSRAGGARDMVVYSLVRGELAGG